MLNPPNDPIGSRACGRAAASLGADRSGQALNINGDTVASQLAGALRADALVLVTEWKPFRHPDLDRMRQAMKTSVIFDGRNQYDPAHVRAAGFEYTGIGR